MTYRKKKRHKKGRKYPVFKNLAAFQAQSASSRIPPLQQLAQLAHMFVGAAVPFTRDINLLEPEDPCKEDHVTITIYCIICGLTHEVDRCQRPDKMIVGGKIVHLHQTSYDDRLVCQFCGLPVIDWKPMQPCPNRDADGDAIQLPAPEGPMKIICHGCGYHGPHATGPHATGQCSMPWAPGDKAVVFVPEEIPANGDWLPPPTPTHAERMVQIARDERRKALVARDEDRKQWERERDQFREERNRARDERDRAVIDCQRAEARISLLEDLLMTKTTPTPIRDAMRTIGQAHLHALGFVIAMLGIVVWTVRTTASGAAQKAASGIKGWLTRRSPWTVFGAMCFLAAVCAWPVHESRFTRTDFGQSDYSIPTRMLPFWHTIKLPSNFNGNTIYVYGPDELQVAWDQPTMTWSETLVQGDETYRFWRNNCGELRLMARGPDGVEHEASLAPVTSKTYR